MKSALVFSSILLVLPLASACSGTDIPVAEDSDDAELTASSVLGLAGHYAGTGALKELDLSADKVANGYAFQAKVGSKVVGGSFRATKKTLTLRFDDEQETFRSGKYTYVHQDGALSLSQNEKVVASLSASAAACGPTTCGAGLECCNSSCGICVPPGWACTQQECASAPDSP